jgi:hypothetical protein
MVVQTLIVRDEANDCEVFCVKFDTPTPTKEDLKEAFELAPYPWGSEDDPQAIPSTYLKETGRKSKKTPGWWDVGNA